MFDPRLHSCKAQQPTQTTTSAQTSTSIPEALPGSPDSKGTPSRKRNIEASKTDSIRAVLAAPTEQTPDIKKLSSEIAEQKKVIAELTAQKETLEHVRTNCHCSAHADLTRRCRRLSSRCLCARC